MFISDLCISTPFYHKYPLQNLKKSNIFAWIKKKNHVKVHWKKEEKIDKEEENKKQGWIIRNNLEKLQNMFDK